MTEVEIKAVMSGFSSAYRAADPDLAVTYLAEDFVWRLPTGSANPQGQVLQGKDAVRTYLRERFAKDARGEGVVFSDGRLEVLGEVVLVHYRVKGTKDDGGFVDAVGMDLFRVADGKLTQKDAYWKQVAWPDGARK